MLPINIIMGQLGSGKTTVIMSLVKQIAGDDYKVVWLKNEYGDVNVDGALAKEQGIQTQEIMNGCVCCTAIGKLEDAIRQVLELKPDRIILETAGTAHPAPIALELKRFTELTIDSFIEVIDALNFQNFENHGFIRQSHAKYVDFIILNKIDLIDEKRLDQVLDEVYTVYPDTPLIKTGDGFVKSDLILSLDHNKVLQYNLDKITEDIDDHAEHHSHVHAFSCKMNGIFNPEDVEKICKAISKQDIYRIKGIILTKTGSKVLNGVMNRFTWSDLKENHPQTEILFIGPGADSKLQSKICEKLTQVKL
jgi:G3E family GTPase